MTQSGRAYFLVPIVYIGVIFGLLFLQFSGGERFTRSVGPLTLNATRGTASDDGTPEVRELRISFDGIAFSFAQESGLIVETSDNVADMRAVGYEALDDGFEVEFEGGYALSFLIGPDPTRELQLRLELPDEPNGLREVSIPFDLAGSPVDGETGRSSFVTLRVDDDEYHLTAPPRATIDLENRKLVLEPEAAGQAIRYVEASEGDPTRVVGWFEDETLGIDDAAYEETIAGWVESAYAGWESGRYNSTALTWDGPGGFASFSEEALTAYLAEAWARDEYDRAFAEMRRAVDLHPEELTLLSAPFLGNLDEVRERFIEADRARIDLLEEQLEAGDPTLFRRPSVFLLAADRGSEELYARLLEFTREIELRSLDLESAIGLLRNLFVDPLPDDRATSVALRSVDLIQLKLLGSIARTDAGFFVQTSPGQIDLYQSAVLGAVLDAYGSSRGDRTITTIGRNLVSSVLSLADDDGMVPSSLLVRGETVETADGAVAPERLYPLLAEAPNYPREVSLYEEAGSGTWVWTIVEVRPVQMSDSEWRFELAYPRLRTHFVLVRGVPSFERMELFGQMWRDAPDFEVYSKGRHYDAETDTLMIKYYDDSVRREMAVFF
ncbi:MAG: hypothetical protein ACOCWX_04335 [Spirochaetota bacterium]